MFLASYSATHGARPFGDELTYRIPTDNGDGEIRVRFAELPIERWHKMSVEEKRDLGITGGHCISILRAGREIDRGWLFMGGKRRENYDDWWRCEIAFDPALDELFGITHAKQSVNPTQALLDLLVPDLEPIARALNSRVRQRFEQVKADAPLGAAERQASRVEKHLPALPRRREVVPDELKELVRAALVEQGGSRLPCRIVAADLPSTSAFEVVVQEGRLVVLLNARHPLYRDLYGPLAISDSSRDQEIAKQVALAMLAVARAEVSTWRRVDRTQARNFRQEWADVLATYLNA
jgi:hypothetical protein